MIQRLRHFAPLLQEMVRREVRGRYAGSALGFFWSVIHPLMQLAIYTLVFGALLRVQVPGAEGISGFALWLFCGLLPWNAFSETLNRSASSLIENASMIKNLRFPAKVIQLALAVNALLHQLLGLAILLGAAAVIRGGLTPAMLLLPVLLALQFMFMFGVGLLVAPFATSFRDFLQLLPVINMVWLYLTPMFYTEAQVPERLRFMLTLNPMRYFVQMSRALILENRVPAWGAWAGAAGFSLVALGAGWAYYTRRHASFADEL